MSGSKNIVGYPRLDFQRSPLKWDSLNGDWCFAYDDDDVGIGEGWYRPYKGIPKDKKRKINVPFVYQTPASGINEQEAHQVIWYQAHLFAPTKLLFDNSPQGIRSILHFGAVDYEATVWLGRHFLGTHRGGHVPFEFDVTGMLDEREPTQLTLRVWDAATDLTQPRGKQYWGPKPEGIFYTPSTGIWQSVWLEYVPPVRIADSSHGTILRSNNIETGDLEAEIAVLGCSKSSQSKYSISITARLSDIEIVTSERIPVDKEKDIARLTLSLKLSESYISKLPKDFKNTYHIHTSGVATWSPEQPTLYDLLITLFDQDGNTLDTIVTSTGVRSLNWSVGDGTLHLNGRPYFQALVLDQGYWPDTSMTPPTNLSCKEDILLAKKMGFNGCRKHQKVESPEFLYWADKLGFLVWGEMANAYEFSDQYISRFDQEWIEAVKRDINHPCIVAWTPVNETWGYGDLKGDERQQNHIRSLYYQTKTLDPTRPINDNCGWEHVCTDLTTFHDYSDGPEFEEICGKMDRILGVHGDREMFVGGTKHRDGAPVICTEFGGVNIKPAEGEKEIEGSWGYTTASDGKDLLKRVEKLIRAVNRGGHCCGFVYTQLTDIEQETNGLYTFDRKEKLPASEVKLIIDSARTEYEEMCRTKKG